MNMPLWHHLQFGVKAFGKKSHADLRVSVDNAKALFFISVFLWHVPAVYS